MRPLFNKGVRPSSFSKAVLELHSKTYFRKYEERKHELTRARRFDPAKEADMFSSFGDKNGYAGLVPTGHFTPPHTAARRCLSCHAASRCCLPCHAAARRCLPCHSCARRCLARAGHYMQTVYKKFSGSIRRYLDNEVKKRGAEILAWDASYKEAKHLARYRGEAVFKALITGTNEIGEIRVQFHVVTDGHDQMVRSLEEMRATMLMYGQIMPKLFFTEKPWDDKTFFQTHIPELRLTQERLTRRNPRLSSTHSFPRLITHACTRSHTRIKSHARVQLPSLCRIDSPLLRRPLNQLTLCPSAAWTWPTL